MTEPRSPKKVTDTLWKTPGGWASASLLKFDDGTLWLYAREYREIARLELSDNRAREIRDALDRHLAAAHPPLCPECQAGKHTNCTGWTLDATDTESPCGCPELQCRPPSSTRALMLTDGELAELRIALDAAGCLGRTIYPKLDAMDGAS